MECAEIPTQHAAEREDEDDDQYLPDEDNAHQGLTVIESYGSDEQHLSGEKVLLWTASCLGDHDTVQRLLLLSEVDIEQGQLGLTPLLAAVCRGHASIVNLLLRAGANGAFATKRQTSLTTAAHNGRNDIVQLLLENNSTKNNPSFVNAARGDGLSPLMLASSEGYTDVALTLIKHGADVNLVNTQCGDTALMIASFTVRPAMVRLLLAHGANAAHRRHKDSSTALHSALIYAPPPTSSYEDTTQIVQMLLDGGADINAAQNDGV
jgi:ankyrin repeat protein